MPFFESQYVNLALTQKEFVLAGGIFPGKERLTNTHIWRQAYEGNLALFNALFHKDNDNMVGIEKTTVFYDLIKQNKLSHIQVFLDNGWDIEKLNSIKETALLAACQTTNLELIDYFIEKGANVNAVNDAQDNMFHLSAKSRNAVEVLEYLYCLFPQENLQKFLLSENVFKIIPFESHLRMFGLEGPRETDALEFMIKNISTLAEAQKYTSCLNDMFNTHYRRPFSHTEELKPYKELLLQRLTIFTEKSELENQLNEEIESPTSIVLNTKLFKI